MLVEHITWGVIQRFQAEVRSGDPAQMWSAVRSEHGKVAAYISDVLRLGRMLHENGEVMDDQGLADVLLSIAVDVYPPSCATQSLYRTTYQAQITLATSNEVESNEEAVKALVNVLFTSSLSIEEVVVPRVADGSGARRNIETLNVMLTPRNTGAAVNTEAVSGSAGQHANKPLVLVTKKFKVVIKLFALVITVLVLATKWLVLMMYTLGLQPPVQAPSGAEVTTGTPLGEDTEEKSSGISSPSVMPYNVCTFTSS
ncbi:hypothetical protein JG688_00014197 [Phytophthora aleatoria]|uniref:Uncharacterized protein n=1 Tax=Phytophthora aleatoria TaxID=2496075 RepID=A0A8J5IVW9_9STRA|nr:hypothetical protein JG688_00014197 [Phytophthora aleatoria]